MGFGESIVNAGMPSGDGSVVLEVLYQLVYSEVRGFGERGGFWVQSYLNIE